MIIIIIIIIIVIYVLIQNFLLYQVELQKRIITN